MRNGDELPQFESLGPFSNKSLMIPFILLAGLAMIPLIDQIQHNSHLLPDHFTHLVYELNNYLLGAALSNMGKNLNAMHLQQPCPAIQHQAEPIEW